MTDGMLTFTMYETRNWSLRARVKFAIAFMLTPLTMILIGRSMRVTATPAFNVSEFPQQKEENQ